MLLHVGGGGCVCVHKGGEDDSVPCASAHTRKDPSLRFLLVCIVVGNPSLYLVRVCIGVGKPFMCPMLECTGAEKPFFCPMLVCIGMGNPFLARCRLAQVRVRVPTPCVSVHKGGVDASPPRASAHGSGEVVLLHKASA